MGSLKYLIPYNCYLLQPAIVQSDGFVPCRWKKCIRAEKSPMALENFIVQLSENCTQRHIDLLTRRVRQWQGEVLVRFPQRATVIVTIDSSKREKIETIPLVELVGGVQIQPSMVRRIKVRQADER